MEKVDFVSCLGLSGRPSITDLLQWAVAVSFKVGDLVRSFFGDWKKKGKKERLQKMDPKRIPENLLEWRCSKAWSPNISHQIINLIVS